MRALLVLALVGMVMARDLTSEWQAYKMEHGKKYEDNLEDWNRFSLWKAALKYIEEFNDAGNATFTLGMNQFGDMTDEEYKQYLGYNMNLKKSESTAKVFQPTMEPEDLPTTVDWRTKGTLLQQCCQ